MRIFELFIIGIILSGCAGCIYLALRDMFGQFEAYEERCESKEEDEE